MKNPNRRQVASDVLAEAMTRVVDYLWSDEEESYLQTPTEHRPYHVFEALLVLSRWLHERRRTKGPQL